MERMQRVEARALGRRLRHLGEAYVSFMDAQENGFEDEDPWDHLRELKKALGGAHSKLDKLFNEYQE